MPARTALLIAALALGLPGGALAAPLRAPESPSAAAETILAHHKPGHRGGPPWARGRGYDDDDRDRTRNRRVEAFDERPRRLACTTRYRAEYDPYLGETVRRPVRVCDERY